MRQITPEKFLPLLLLATLLLTGCAGKRNQLKAGDNHPPAPSAENVYSGRIVGISNKAGTISVDVKGRIEMIRFDDATEGKESVGKDEAVVINFRIEGQDKIATVIKQQLATLPAGATEIQLEEVAALVAKGPARGNYFLVDSRPASRYHEGHIPTAVSIPVSQLKESGMANFPGDALARNTVLIFYCGGVT